VRSTNTIHEHVCDAKVLHIMQVRTGTLDN